MSTKSSVPYMRRASCYFHAPSEEPKEGLVMSDLAARVMLNYYRSQAKRGPLQRIEARRFMEKTGKADD